MMNTNPQQYPTRFYAATFPWTAILFLTLFGVPAIMSALDCFGVARLFGQPPNLVVGILFLLFGFGCMFYAIQGIFHNVHVFYLLVRRMPILQIYREGICMRRFIADQTFCLQWKSIWIDSNNSTPESPRSFRFQKAKEQYPIKIMYWHEKERNDGPADRECIDIDYEKFTFEPHAFSTPIAKVSESVQFFLHNPDARETLPSWQDEETLLGNDTFDFR